MNVCFIDEAQEAEAIQVINAILGIREKQSVQTPAVMCKIYFTTAMLQFILGDLPKVSESQLLVPFESVDEILKCDHSNKSY